MTNASLDYEIIARGFYLEGLLIDGDDIWYTDVVVGGVQLAGSDTVLLGDRLMIGGLLLNQDGSLLVAGERDIAWVNPKTGASGSLADGLPGSNEMVADGNGIVFGTIDLPAILRGEKPGPSSICRLAPDGTLTRLYDGLAFANGLAISADGETLFFNESFSASRAFPRAEDGALGPPRLLADKPDCDGMALDAEGNVLITGFLSDHVTRVTAEGRNLPPLATPPGAVTQLRFGGADLRDFYINVVPAGAGECLRDGKPLTDRSYLYRGRSDTPGMAVPAAGFRLG